MQGSQEHSENRTAREGGCREETAPQTACQIQGGRILKGTPFQWTGGRQAPASSVQASVEAPPGVRQPGRGFEPTEYSKGAESPP